MSLKIKEILEKIPSSPGIYLLKNAQGVPLYIGKAKSLRSRVSSYFSESAAHALRTQTMVQQVEDIDFILTKTEVEALILESNFIKKYQPKYNILLKDDKHYPYLRITARETYPRLEIVRKVKKDGGIYFGPYAQAKEVRQTLRLIHKIFPLRQCKGSLDGVPNRRPCLNFQMRRCLGPCAGEISKEEYGKVVEETVLFLKGRNRDLQHLLKKEMEEASRRLEFEKAATIRDQLAAIQNLAEPKTVSFAQEADLDILGFFTENRMARMQVLSIRGGKMMTQRSYSLHVAEREEGREILNSFIKQYYGEAVFIPPEIVIGEDVPDKDLIQQWLTDKRGARVVVSVPQKGKKRFLVRMAEENARSSFFKTVDDQKRKKSVLMELQRAFSLRKYPRHIDAFDISNIFGTVGVGGVVAFRDGEPAKERYRRFTIKGVEGADDYAMLEETLERHFGKIKEKEGLLPDLVLIDGGKGHLHRAVRVLKKLGLEDLEVLSVAKGRDRNRPETDEIFRPGEPDPIATPPHHPGRRLLQSIRDEAHRFAITAHRKLREKKAKVSVLEEIGGIGPKRRLALMKQFKGLDGIKNASVEDLLAVPGMTAPLAAAVKERLSDQMKFKS